jgi:hypothetical protein
MFVSERIKRLFQKQQKGARSPSQMSGYLANFKTKIEPVLICTLFGLYKCRELPPTDEKNTKFFSKSHEFNVDISSFADYLNHLLFCLWIKKNGFPEKCSSIARAPLGARSSES